MLNKVASALALSVALSGVSAVSVNWNDRTNASVVRTHGCRAGAFYGGPYNGWIQDDITTPQKDWKYVDIGHASNSGGRYVTTFSCTK